MAGTVSRAVRNNAGAHNMIMMEAVLALKRDVNRRNGPLMKVMRKMRKKPRKLKIPPLLRFFTRRGVAGLRDRDMSVGFTLDHVGWQ